jgi:hypothetical protein
MMVYLKRAGSAIARVLVVLAEASYVVLSPSFGQISQGNKESKMKTDEIAWGPRLHVEWDGHHRLQCGVNCRKGNIEPWESNNAEVSRCCFISSSVKLFCFPISIHSYLFVSKAQR